MQKIKIITDSTSDISAENAKQHNIRVLGYTVSIDDKIYKEGVDFTNEEFYRLADNAKTVPKTSQIPVADIREAYEEAYKGGYTEVIYISIASVGSNSYNNSLTARNEFFEDNKGTENKFKIHIIDSRNYTASYGYAAIQASIKAQKGAGSREILTYLQDWFNCVEVYFVPYDLKFIRKSGRFPVIAAFAGELLGIRPMICFIDNTSSVTEKIRGNKNIIPKLIDIAHARMTPQTPYTVMYGSLTDYNEEFIREITKRLGYPPEYSSQIGATVGTHIGHRTIGLAIKGANRHS